MNAIVAFCHFCEQHGPSVVMCTQPYKQLQKLVPSSHITSGEAPVDSNNILKNLINHINLESTSSSSDFSSVVTPPTSEQIIASKSLPTTTYPSSHHQPEPIHPTCKACSSIPRDEPGIISRDQAANISYVSTQCLKDPDLNTFVRNACLRSLSSEVFPDIEGAFYFGDEINGHVMSYIFHINDSQARGNQSRYSILILSWDRVYLLNLWPFLVSNVSRMVSRLRFSADRVFNMETSENVPVCTAIGFTSNQSSRPLRRCATPPAALAPVPYGQAIAAGNAVITGSGLFYQHHSGGGEGQRHRRALDSNMRPLGELTKDDQIFYRIHAWFTWLLRAGGRRWNVVPSLTAPPEDEDSLISREEYEARIAAGAEQKSSNPGLLMTNQKISIGALSQTSNTNLVTSSQLTSCSTNVIPNIIYLGGNKILDLNSISVDQQNAILILILSRLFTVLGLNPFYRLVQHIAIGNQVVIQPLNEALLGPIVLNALAKLLPKGCLKQVSGSQDYLPPFHCNLLSLNPDVIPNEADWNANDGVLFLSVFSQPNKFQQPSNGTNNGDNDDDVNNQTWLIDEFVNSICFRLCNTMPTLDHELVQFKEVRQSKARGSSSNHIAVAARGLTSQIPMSGFVDQVVQLVSMQPVLDPQIQLRMLNTIKNEWINRARLLYSFKRCQGPNIGADEATRRWASVLASINCSSTENAAVVRFWQGALSQYSRNHVCHIRKRPTSSSTSRRVSCCSSNADLNTLFAVSSLNDFGV